ncbi:MAG TPA: hypothetical protein ENO08_03385 [Candidatus Eisenbacteria bacterium]|uniref:Sodium:solute symporter family protein n=1 Tax=Eiseniibacteriota bacterium TaxID=2212470 RepID=A0A7V2AUG4_UNCEI|nr:hypothetical protein [Candidatus Eisenbacteria bacterium]
MSLVNACILVLFVYIGLLMMIGLWTARKTRTAEDFMIGGRTIGPWVTALSFIAVYYSSVLIIGGGAFGYKYGMGTLWIGAINVLVGSTLCWIVLSAGGSGPSASGWGSARSAASSRSATTARRQASSPPRSSSSFSSSTM